eukprot:TRINITY_DN12448_c0_g1_i3.p3 TRINITY_DN12448_c0_g1~~TRINITY_DN12448_c0_g1_i3.p3  ORF type:complete len:287 (+),score=21.39 TRINITY_DN12448_c0_g1_i3:5452-6312(+)
MKQPHSNLNALILERKIGVDVLFNLDRLGAAFARMPSLSTLVIDEPSVTNERVSTPRTTMPQMRSLSAGPIMASVLYCPSLRKYHARSKFDPAVCNWSELEELSSHTCSDVPDCPMPQLVACHTPAPIQRRLLANMPNLQSLVPYHPSFGSMSEHTLTRVKFSSGDPNPLLHAHADSLVAVNAAKCSAHHPLDSLPSNIQHVRFLKATPECWKLLSTGTFEHLQVLNIRQEGVARNIVQAVVRNCGRCTASAERVLMNSLPPPPPPKKKKNLWTAAAKGAHESHRQ